MSQTASSTDDLEELDVTYDDFDIRLAELAAQIPTPPPSALSTYVPRHELTYEQLHLR